MPRKKAQKPSLPIAKKEEPGFIAWNGPEDFQKKMAEGTYQGGDGFSRSNYSFVDINTNTNVRNPYTRGDYEYFRPNEKLPTKPKDMIAVCLDASNRIGIVNRVMNLMAEFSCQGINLRHKDPKIQKYYRRWFEKVRGKERSERFISLLVRAGQVPIQRSTAKVAPSMLETRDFAISEPDLKVERKEKPERNEIPVRYTILNPLALEVVEPELAILAHQPIYAIKLDGKLREKIKKPQGEIQEELVERLPKSLRDAAISKDGMYILSPKKFSMYFYKKDDWMLWARPLLYPILSDIFQLEKTKMADLAALDGAISSVRLWRLGSMEHKIMPNAAQIQRLSNVLTSNTGGGAIDLVWGPEIDFKESDSKLHNFLGKEKYESVMNQIYAGLGIPPTLTGNGGGNSGFTNNFISLKTFIETLEYVRAILKEFWDNEIRLVQDAKGFSEPAYVTFEHMSLSDESAEKMLWIHLADRDLISMETLQEKFGEIPELEAVRLKKEGNMRKSEKLPQKAGPWHNPQQEFDLKKIALQTEQATPTEVGIELEEPTGHDIKEIELRHKRMEKEAKPDPKPFGGSPSFLKPKGQPGQGRPKNKKDSQKRKQKVVKPRSFSSIATLYNWARKTYFSIGDVLDPFYVELCGKLNLRGLTAKEADTYENLKFGVLSSMVPFSKVDKSALQNTLTQRIKMPSGLANLRENILQESRGDDLTLDDKRNISCLAYAYFYGKPDEDIQS